MKIKVAVALFLILIIYLGTLQNRSFHHHYLMNQPYRYLVLSIDHY